MSILRSVILGAIGVGLAMSNTNESPGTMNLAGDTEPPKMTPRPAVHPLKPSEKLNLWEWMALMRELRYWEDGDEPVAKFWERLDAWDEEQLLLESLGDGVGLLGLGSPATGGVADLVQADTSEVP